MKNQEFKPSPADACVMRLVESVSVSKLKVLHAGDIGLPILSRRGNVQTSSQIGFQQHGHSLQPGVSDKSLHSFSETECFFTVIAEGRMC